MSDRRDEIIAGKRGFSSKEGFLFPIESVKDAMDDYMKEICLQLIEYMGKHRVVCGEFMDSKKFFFKGEWITKEQLFENFL